MAKPLALEERVIIAVSMALKAKQHFLLWRLTHGVEGHRKHRSVYNEYWEAIRFLQNGQLIAAIVELHSLWERRTETINLAGLLDEVEGVIGKPLAGRTALAEAVSSVMKIRLLRNAAIAHRTNKKSYNDVFAKAAITVDQIEGLIDLAINLANDLLEALGADRQELNPLPLETYNRLFRDLSEVNSDE